MVLSKMEGGAPPDGRLYWQKRMSFRVGQATRPLKCCAHLSKPHARVSLPSRARTSLLSLLFSAPSQYGTPRESGSEWNERLAIY